MYEQIAANKRKSATLVVVMAVLLLALGYAAGEYFGGVGSGGGYIGLVIAFGVWLIMTLVAYYQGDQVFLHLSKARKIQKKDLPVLWNVVEEMTIASGLGKMPAVYVIDDPAPNAFATGRKTETAAVAVTSGLLRICNRDELQGVIAHEIGHIRNRDILLMLYAGVLAGAIVLLADIGLRSMIWGGAGRSRRSSGEGGGQAQAIIMIVAIALMILAPLFAQLIYFAISRKREYLADASAAVFTRYPEGLASALEKLAADPAKLGSATRATAPMFIVNPLKVGKKAAASATATHPPIADRVKILRAMTGSSYADYEQGYEQVHGSKKTILPRSALDDTHAGSALRFGDQAAQYRGEAAAETAGPAAGAAGAAAGAAMVGLAAAGAAAETESRATGARARARAVDDFFYREDGYRQQHCQCGTVLKIPPGFTATRIKCPRCGTMHDTSSFVPFTPGEGGDA